MKAIDLIYNSLKVAIIKSYESGEMDNSMGQMEESLSSLDALYDAKLFRNGRIRQAKVLLLREIQARVDEAMGKKIYSDMWE